MRYYLKDNHLVVTSEIFKTVIILLPLMPVISAEYTLLERALSDEADKNGVIIHHFNDYSFMHYEEISSYDFQKLLHRRKKGNIADIFVFKNDLEKRILG